MFDFKPSSTEGGGGYILLKNFFRAFKTPNSTLKWLEIIVGSSFLAFLSPPPPYHHTLA